MPEGKGVKVEKGPGDFTEKPKVPSWRGEDGKGGDPESTEKDSASVEYDR